MAPSSVEEIVNIVVNYCTHLIRDTCLISLKIHVCMCLKPQYCNSSKKGSRIFD